MKLFFRRIHLYLGLATGAIIMITCFTGALLVFQKELEQSLHKHRYFVVRGSTRLSIDSLTASVHLLYPKAGLNSIKIYSDASRSAEINIQLPDKNGKKTEEKKEQGPEHAGKKGQGENRNPGLTVFVNPYTGAILEMYNPRESFFFKVMTLHRWLTGSNNSAGKYIVGISTLIFLFILITGIILWWPKNKRILIQRLKIKRTTNRKRLNHDLHVVLGFYTAIFLFIAAFTALPMSFEWANNSIYKLTGSPQKPPAPAPSVYNSTQYHISYSEALVAAKTILPDAVYYMITSPKDSLSPFTVSALGNQAAHESATDAVYIDQYSGKITGHLLYAERSSGARIRSTIRPIHVGSIGGLSTKIIAVIVCLLGTSFPVTGVIMWAARTGIWGDKRIYERTHQNKGSAFPI